VFLELEERPTSYIGKKDTQIINAPTWISDTYVASFPHTQSFALLTPSPVKIRERGRMSKSERRWIVCAGGYV